MKKVIISILIVCVILIVPVVNLINLLSYNAVIDTSFIADMSIFDKFDGFDVSAVEKEIDELNKQRNEEAQKKRLEEERRQSYNNLMKQIDNGIITFRQLFSDTLIVGDSLMKGLETYRVLDSANMITMVSASLYHLEGNINKIIANSPDKLLLHYGINMLVDNDSYLAGFVQMYGNIIVRLKTALPDTEIYVSGIFNVAPRVERQYPCVEKYNANLKEMCTELSVNFVDNSSVLPGDGKYYGSDGVHLSKSFYTEVWLPHLFYSMLL